MNLWVELSPLFAKIFEASPIEILHVSQMHSSLKGSSKRIKREIHNQINPVSLVRKDEKSWRGVSPKKPN